MSLDATGAAGGARPALGAAFRERLGRGEVLVGCNVRHSRTAEIGAILADCGFAWIMLDNEHSPMASDTGYDIALGAIRAGVVPLARVRRNEPAEIASWLTNGTLGVIVPHVDSVEQARCAARAARFPPEGELSVPGSIPQFGYGLSLAEATRRFNAEALTVAMIESRAALEQVDAIAATPGIDILFIGASDMVYDLGLPGGYGRPELADAVARTVAAARAHGKHVGMGGVREDAHWARFIGLGVRMVLTENDLTLLMNRARERARFFGALQDAACGARA
jgi:2-keto-3-deoxy-L-rhamnonate aldolase RhmA